MWSLRILTGEMAGHTFRLKQGRNVIGRAAHCDVIIVNSNISKEHSQIEIYNDKIIVSDLMSRNGTFINGVQIKSHKLLLNERIGFFDIVAIIEKTSLTSSRAKTNIVPPPLPATTRAQPAYHGNAAYSQPAAQMAPEMPPHLSVLSAAQQQPQQPIAAPGASLFSYLRKYIDEVVLPGVYNLLYWMEFKYALGIFVAAFIILVTSLSTVPLMRILKSSIEKEAQNRAQTIARTLARDNRNAVMQGQLSLVTTENAEREAGATAYVIASPNGDILAPPRLMGQYLTHIDFVNEAKKSNQELVNQVSSDMIVAVAPIRFYEPSTGAESTAAHAVVVYNMGALAIDDGRTLSLFIQILFIALVVGGLLFFFMYRIVLEPLTNLNAQLNKSLKENKSTVSTPYAFPELQELVANLNSLISRGDGGFAGQNLQQQFEVDRTQEMQNLVNLVGFAALTINGADRTINCVNEHFTNQLAGTQSWLQLPVDKITDQALKLNIINLLDRIANDPNQLVTDQLEISNQSYDISAQGIMGSKAVVYVILVFIPRGG